jgi:hypothetical protein
VCHKGVEGFFIRGGAQENPSRVSIIEEEEKICMDLLMH